ncbi:hypothetical protein [Streptomyces sp. NPDC004014]
MRRTGPKPVVPLGMAIAAAGMVWMTTLDLGSGYTTQMLPQLVLVGIGLGTVTAPAMSLATSGMAAADAGVASAAVNTVQQVGGSIGVALLGTMALHPGEQFSAPPQGRPADGSRWSW